MTDPTMPQTVEAAEAELHDEHRALRDMVGRVQAAEDVITLAPLLDELHPLLQLHFAHEEYPGGLYDRLGTQAPQFRHDVRQLVDEHFRMLSMIRGLAVRARTPGDDEPAEILDEARRLVAWLADHERREHAMARAAREDLES